MFLIEKKDFLIPIIYLIKKNELFSNKWCSIRDVYT